MKKQVKMISTILLVMMILCSITNVVLGAGVIASLSGDKTTTVSGQGITNLGSTIVGVLQIIGIIVAVVVLLVLGIKYMMGSASEKAEYKKTMIPYLVGAILIFGASAITKVVVSLGTSFND